MVQQLLSVLDTRIVIEQAKGSLGESLVQRAIATDTALVPDAR